jgi:hypothetical protein
MAGASSTKKKSVGVQRRFRDSRKTGNSESRQRELANEAGDMTLLSETQFYSWLSPTKAEPGKKLPATSTTHL